MGQLFNRLRRFVASEFSSEPNARTQYDSSGLLQDDELRKIIDELSGKAESKNYQQTPPKKQQQQNIPQQVLAAHIVLGVRVGASVQEIKLAYRKAITTWHPDKFVRAETNLQQEAHIMARKINAAYTVLEEYYKFG